MESMPSLESAEAYIKALDFSNIINKMVHHQGWKRHHAERLAEHYRRFLLLNRRYADQQLPPSEEIDLFWHNHILDTRQYQGDCQAIFGAYHHHYPYFGIDDKTDAADLSAAFETTQALYLRDFNEPLCNVRLNLKRLLKSLFKSFFMVLYPKHKILEGVE